LWNDGGAEKSRCAEILAAVYPCWSGRDNLPDLNVTLEGEKLTRITELRAMARGGRLFDRFLFEHSWSLAQTPLIDYLDVEAPVAPDFETG